MTVNKDMIQNSLRQLEALLFHDDILNETESHPLFILRDQLHEIDSKSQLTTIDEKHQVISILNYFEINCFFQFIERYSSLIPSSILKALFDTIRFQLNINMKMNPSMTDRYFALSLDYLTANSTIDYLTGKKEIQTKVDEYFLNLFSSMGACSVDIKTNVSYSICVSRKNIPEFFQLNPSTERLLQAFISYLDKYFSNNYQQYESSISILKWILNLTDIYGFVSHFVKTGYPNTVLQWMKMNRDQTEHISAQSWFLIINLLHNLARHWTGVKALNKLKAIDILKQWKDQYLSESSSFIQYNENDKDILIAYYLVYAILLEPKELKKENISNIQTVLDYILERTVQAFNSPDLCYGPYNVCEYLKGLAKLVVNDKFLNYITSRDNILDLFIEKFLLFNTNFQSTDLNMIICSSLYTIFWSISFQEEYDSKLKSIDKFIQFVEQMSKSELDDEHTIMMKRAAKGILFNLDLIQMDIQPIEENINNQTKLMVSYAHKDATFCRKLVTSLQERFQGEIWVDFNKFSAPYEDDWEEIAKAITQCDVILMIVTENYCSSKSCRREVIHADKRNKRMIPIYQGKDYKPEDWFEIRVGSATWVRFGDKKSEEEVMTILSELINKIKRINNDIVPCHELKFNGESQTNTTIIIDRQTVQTSLSVKSNPIEEISDIQVPLNPITSAAVRSTSPIEQWTDEEVQEWLHLPPSTLQLSSGRALITYMNLLSHENAQYDEYEHRMRSHGVSRERFANLISSFSSLRSSNNIEPILTRFPEQWTCKEVKDWFRENHLSNYLWNTFNFVDGSQLVTYAKLILDSPARIDDEYDRLQHQIGKDLFHLDEYARLLSGLEKLVNQSKSKEESSLCTIL